MNNNHITKILFCATIAVICVSDCGNVRKQQKADANTEALEVMLDSLNLSDSTPATIKNIDSRLVNADGEEWVLQGEKEYSCFYVFRADGSFDYRFFETETNNNTYAISGKWNTNNDRTTLFLIYGGEIVDDSACEDECDNSLDYIVTFGTTLKIGNQTFKKQQK